MKLDKTLPKALLKAAKAYNRANPGRIAAIEDERTDASGRAVNDGSAHYWIYTTDGYCVDPECHTGTGYDVEDAINTINGIRPCACDRCTSKESI